MFEKLIHKIVSIFPKPLQGLYYKYEYATLYFLRRTYNYCIYCQPIYRRLFQANTALATTISWICAVTFAFFTNKSIVFKSKTETKSEFLANACILRSKACLIFS